MENKVDENKELRHASKGFIVEIFGAYRIIVELVVNSLARTS